MEVNGIKSCVFSALGDKKARRRPAVKATGKAVVSAKYRDRKAGATWTGHGRAPAWIASAMDRTKCLIDDRRALKTVNGTVRPSPGFPAGLTETCNASNGRDCEFADAGNCCPASSCPHHQCSVTLQT
ncbi:H-NS histone family protein [Burkholderia diffusa]|uniref:H-NS histone family protein n=1 Tax=Burkholderia diffusa TaxID=488732 RepID=UPI0009BDA3F1